MGYDGGTRGHANYSDRASRQTAGYVFYRAGQDVAKQEQKHMAELKGFVRAIDTNLNFLRRQASPNVLILNSIYRLKSQRI